MKKEKWKPVVGWETLYEVSNFGNVRSLPRTGNTQFGERMYGGKIIAPIFHKTTGYLVVNLTKHGRREQKLIHRLVLEAFKGQTDNSFQCCHKNGLRTDNRLSNLRWGTTIENSADKIAHGTVAHGEKNGFSKLNNNIVDYIRKSKFKATELATSLPVTAETIRRIRRRELWKHI